MCAHLLCVIWFCLLFFFRGGGEMGGTNHSDNVSFCVYASVCLCGQLMSQMAVRCLKCAMKQQQQHSIGKQEEFCDGTIWRTNERRRRDCIAQSGRVWRCGGWVVDMV